MQLEESSEVIEMKKAFFTIGSVIIALVAGLVLSAVYLIEKHAVDLRKKKTQPAREQRLKNLEDEYLQDRIDQNGTKEYSEAKTEGPGNPSS